MRHNCRVELRRRQRCVLNSQLARDDCRCVRSHCRHDATRLRCWQICSDSSRLSPTSCEFRTHGRHNSTRQFSSHRRCVWGIKLPICWCAVCILIRLVILFKSLSASGIRLCCMYCSFQKVKHQKCDTCLVAYGYVFASRAHRILRISALF